MPWIFSSKLLRPLFAAFLRKYFFRHLITQLISFAKEKGSKGFANEPVILSSIISGKPPISNATTGVPQE